MRPVFRPDPRLPAAAYTTYAVTAPLTTHWRPASCAEIDCRAYLHGWRTVLDPADETNAARLHYIRTQSGRRFHEDRDDHGQVVFTFEPGQSCFERHQQPLEREPIYLRRGGDWRGNPLGDQLVHRRAEDWVDDFQHNLDRVKTATERG